MELDNLALKESLNELIPLESQNFPTVSSSSGTTESEGAYFFEEDDETDASKPQQDSQADISELTETDNYSGCGPIQKKKAKKREKVPSSPAQSESDLNGSDDDNIVRRSTRNPDLFYLSKPDVKRLIGKIQANDEDTVVLKIKQHGITDINCAVVNEILKALWSNKVCQALYMQNISKAMKNEQLEELLRLLKKKLIWCLNLGENYEISGDMWKKFTKTLPETNVTHLYVSEHIIPIELKNEMRANIRENRKKHVKHCSIKNISVIERCTHCWWDPINGIKELKAQPSKNPTPAQSQKKKNPDAKTLKPEHAAFWAEGLGKGGDKPWKFRCTCGEVCSSYENYRYHPVGRMYECSRCSIWSHVDCVLGPEMTDEDIDEIVDLLCSHCNTKISRLKRYYGDDYQQYDDRSDIYQLTEKDLVYARDNNTGSKKEISPLEKVIKLEKTTEVKKVKSVEKESSSRASMVKTDMPPPAAPMKKKFPKLTSSLPEKKKSSSSSSSAMTGRRSARKRKLDDSDDDTDEDAADGEWRFKCLCGETCSWYEKSQYRPSGKKYQCTNCDIWSHVGCMFGDKITDKELHEMKDAHCYTCKSKLRRARREKSENEPEGLIPSTPVSPSLPVSKRSRKNRKEDDQEVPGNSDKSLAELDNNDIQPNPDELPELSVEMERVENPQEGTADFQESENIVFSLEIESGNKTNELFDEKSEIHDISSELTESEILPLKLNNFRYELIGLTEILTQEEMIDNIETPTETVENNIIDEIPYFLPSYEK